MNRVVSWAELVAVIEPVYPKVEGPGRPPVGVNRMLRVHCLHLGREAVPDKTTICKFCHVLEAHQVGVQLFGVLGSIW